MFCQAALMTEPRKLSFARRMRRAPAWTEDYAWQLLRDHRLGGLKFRRQVPLGPYVVDFACFRRRLVIELDGPFHDPVADAERDAWLKGQNFKVLRLKNEEFLSRRDEILDQILRIAGLIS